MQGLFEGEASLRRCLFCVLLAHIMSNKSWIDGVLVDGLSGRMGNLRP